MGNEVFKFTQDCKIGMKWRIKEADLQNVQGHACLMSKTFKANIPGVKYCLKIYPNGKNETDKDNVIIYLQLEFKAEKGINACITISVKSVSVCQSFPLIIFNGASKEHGKVLHYREIIFNPRMKFFVDGYMEVELDGTLTAQEGNPKVAKPFSLAQLLWKNDDKDITIVVEKNELQIHKLILTAASSVFKTELSNPRFKEASENKIVITDFCLNTVKMAVDFCYELDIDDGIKINASEILHFADKYDMQELHEYVQTKLIEILSESNVCNFANASLTSNAHELREYCVCFLIKAAKQSKIIDGTENLGDEIKSEIAGRSFIFVSE